MKYILVCIVALFLSACKSDMGYVPIAAFEPSYKALQGADNNNYNLEETVRILNGMELAQANSENFDAFLEYMACQDYSKVAQDVVDLRLSLLPILQEMYLIEEEYGQRRTDSIHCIYGNRSMHVVAEHSEETRK